MKNPHIWHVAYYVEAERYWQVAGTSSFRLAKARCAELVAAGITARMTSANGARRVFNPAKA